MTSPAGIGLLEQFSRDERTLWDDQDFDPNGVLRRAQVGRALKREVGVTPAAVQKPGEAPGFWGGLRRGLAESGKWAARQFTVGAALPPPGPVLQPAGTIERIARQPRAQPMPEPPPGVGGFIGSMAGSFINPIDLTVTAATGALLNPVIQRGARGLATAVGSRLAGHPVAQKLASGATHAMAEGAQYGAIENPIANTFHEIADPNTSYDPLDFAGRRAFDVGAGAVLGGGLDLAVRGGIEGAKLPFRGENVMGGAKMRSWETFPDPDDAFRMGREIWKDIQRRANDGEFGLDEYNVFRAWWEEMEAKGRRFQSELDALTAFDELQSAPDDISGQPARSAEEAKQKEFEDVYLSDATFVYQDIIEKNPNATLDDIKKAFKEQGFPENLGFIRAVEESLYGQSRPPVEGDGDAPLSQEKNPDPAEELQAEIDFLMQEREDIRRALNEIPEEEAGWDNPRWAELVERQQEIDDMVQRLEEDMTSGAMDEDPPPLDELDDEFDAPESWKNTVDETARDGPQGWKGDTDPWYELSPEIRQRAMDIIDKIRAASNKQGTEKTSFDIIREAFNTHGLPDDNDFINRALQEYVDDIKTREINLRRTGPGGFPAPINRIRGLTKGWRGQGPKPELSPTSEPILDDLSGNMGDLSLSSAMGVQRPVREGPALIEPSNSILGFPPNRIDPMGGFSLNEGGLAQVWEAGKRIYDIFRSQNLKWRDVISEAVSNNDHVALAVAATNHVGGEKAKNGADFLMALRKAQAYLTREYTGSGVTTPNVVVDAYRMLGAMADDVVGRPDKIFAQRTGDMQHRWWNQPVSERNLVDAANELSGSKDSPVTDEKGARSVLRAYGYRDVYKTREGTTFYSDFAALEKGIDLVRRGAASFKQWLEGMKKEGVTFDSQKVARQRYREALKDHANIFDGGVINVEKYLMDISGSRRLAEMAAKHKDLKAAQVETKEGIPEEARAFANSLGLEYSALDIPKAKQLSGREIKLRELAITENIEAMESLAKILDSLPDEFKADAQTFLDAVMRQTDNLLHDVVVGASQKGRDLNMLRAMSRKTEDPSFWLVQAKRQLGPERPMTAEVQAEILAAVNRLKTKKRGTPERAAEEAALAARIKRLADRHWMQQMADIFKAVITPVGIVDIVNLFANTAMGGVEAVSKSSAATIERLVAPLFFHGRRTTIAPYQFKNAQVRALALKMAGKVARGTMRGEADPTMGGKFAAQVGEFTLLPSQRANVVVNRYLEWHWRRFGAADAAFREYHMVLSLWSDSIARAYNEGFRGRDLRTRAEVLFYDPDVVMVNRAIERAQYATFTKDNVMAEAVTVGRSKLTPGLKATSHFMVPFLKVLANVAEVSVDYTPAVGFIKTMFRVNREQRAMKGRQYAERVMTDAKGGDMAKLAQKHEADTERVSEETQRLFMESLGRQTTGAAIAAAGFMLAQMDAITGFGPRNQAERDQWEAEGRQALAFRQNGKWRNYSRILGPFAPLLAMGAETYQVTQDMKRRVAGVTTGDRAKQAVRGYVGSIAESAPGGSLSVFGRRNTTDPEGDVLGGIATSVMAIPGRAAEATDPYERRTKNFKERLMSRTPGLRDNLPVKVRSTGEPVKSETYGVALFDPTRPKKDTSTPVLREMRRLGVNFTMPSKIGTYSQAQQNELRKRGLTDTRVPEKYERPRGEIDRIAEISGPRIHERLEKLMSRSAYQQWDDGRKRRAVLSIMTEERVRADKQVTRSYRQERKLPGVDVK